MEIASQTGHQTYTIKQIIDYMDCPLCYHLKYIKKVPPSPENSTDNFNIAYQEAMLETINYYFIEHQRRKPPTLKHLISKFYNLWLQKTGTEDTASILTRPIENSSIQAKNKENKYVKHGYDVLAKFYNRNAETKQAVLGVHHPYKFQLKNVSILGHFDLVREVVNRTTRKRGIELIYFQLSSTRLDDDILQRNLVLMANAFAFEQNFDVKPDRFMIYYVGRDEIVTLTYTLNDYKKLLSIIEGFRVAVNTVPPYPRPGAHDALTRQKAYCEKYQF